MVPDLSRLGQYFGLTNLEVLKTNVGTQFFLPVIEQSIFTNADTKTVTWFTQQVIKPILTDKLSVCAQKVDFAVSKYFQKSITQFTALTGIRVAFFIQHYPNQRECDTVMHYSQCQHIKHGLTELLIGAVDRNYPRFGDLHDFDDHECDVFIVHFKVSKKSL
jgi:hypothetical protein